MLSSYRAATTMTAASRLLMFLGAPSSRSMIPLGSSRSVSTAALCVWRSCPTSATRITPSGTASMIPMVLKPATNAVIAYMSTTMDGNNNTTGSTNSDQSVKRPFTILGVQQIAIGHDDRTSLHHLWYTVFGLQPTEQNIIMEHENVCEDIIQLGLGNTDDATTTTSMVEIDLMTPLDVNKSPKVHVPPLNHIGLWVDDLVSAVEYMTTQHGVRFTPGGIRKGASGYDVTFIHPKGNDTFPVGGNGILIELVQAPDHIIQSYSNSRKTMS